MLNVYSKSSCNVYNKMYFPHTFFGGSNQVRKTVHNSPILKYPQVHALKLPTNVVNINEAEMGRFSPLRERDLSGPVINAYNLKHELSGIDITVQSDPHVTKYDCRGAVSLSSSMQSNVPSPFSGNHTHLNMPGSQWGQGYKYLSDHLQSAHYLTLRNEYRGKLNNKVSFFTLYLSHRLSFFQSIVITIGSRNMSTETDTPLSAKDKLKKAVKDYGATVVVFHVTISLFSLGGCYILVSSGVDVMAILKYLNIGEGTLSNAVTSNAGTFVIAYGIHKILAPARIAITLTATPFIVRYLRNIGILKTSGGGK